MNALEKAILLLDGQAAVAKVASEATGIQVQQQNVSYWLKKRGGKVPAEFAAAIAQACRARDPSTSVTKEALSPDFPWASVAKTAHA